VSEKPAYAASEEWVERHMPADERAWLEVATHALYRAQNAAGVQALVADDLALLHRYQATHAALAALAGEVRAAEAAPQDVGDLDECPRCGGVVGADTCEDCGWPLAGAQPHEPHGEWCPRNTGVPVRAEGCRSCLAWMNAKPDSPATPA
jgi:hypothetical protein